MKTIFSKRILLSLIVSVSHGSLLAWLLTLSRKDSNQLLAMLSVIGLLLFFHIISSNVLGRSILIITSYLEGLFFFLMTMAAFRIGDHLLAITNLSFRTEIFIFGLAAICALLYVWAMRMVVKDQ